jgi:broad specificity phosphatase PhoE
MKWYIIRHANKEEGNFYNPKLRHQDPPLSGKGRLKAQGLLLYFSDKPIDRIYISEYIRTEQTIKYVAEKKEISPIIDSRLNEIDNGLIEGMSKQMLQQHYPDVWNAFQERDRDFQFPEGESGEEAQKRIDSFFKDKQASNEDLILVSHDGLIRLLMCSILEIPVYRRWDFQVDTCGIMEIGYQAAFKKWKLIRFNYVCA